VQCHGPRLRCAVLTRVAVRGLAAHDFAGDSPLIGHPQATSFLSVFSISPWALAAGSWASWLRGGMRRRVVTWGT
jgi:hypothetical protein